MGGSHAPLTVEETASDIYKLFDIAASVQLKSSDQSTISSNYHSFYNRLADSSVAFVSHKGNLMSW
jgi:hypothetical protein